MNYCDYCMVQVSGERERYAHMEETHSEIAVSLIVAHWQTMECCPICDHPIAFDKRATHLRTSHQKLDLIREFLEEQKAPLPLTRRPNIPVSLDELFWRRK